jgi:hypothetical protein
MTFPGQQEAKVADNHTFTNPALSGSHRNDCGHLLNSSLVDLERMVCSLNEN